MRTRSSTWSVYDGEWNCGSETLFAPLTCPFPSQELSDSGVVKVELIRRGAQGAVYSAIDTQRSLFVNKENTIDICASNNKVSKSTLDENNKMCSKSNELKCLEQEEKSLQEEYEYCCKQENEQHARCTQANLCAVKRIFTQPNDFGRRGIADTVLREVTLLKYINQKQHEYLSLKRSDSDRIECTQQHSAKVIALDRIVEAPHRELCMVMELCVLNLEQILIQHRSSQSMFSPNYKQTSSAHTHGNEDIKIFSKLPNDITESSNNDELVEKCFMSDAHGVNSKNINNYSSNNINNDVNNNNNDEDNSNTNNMNLDEDISESCFQFNNQLCVCKEEQSHSQLPLIRYLLRRICRVVYFLHHCCHVVHRDLKLSNILVTDTHELRLSDFGSARFITPAIVAHNNNNVSKCSNEPTTTVNSTENQSPLHVESIFSGLTPSSMRTTLLYQSPESLLGEHIVPTALDVWSLGVIFAELVLQRHLFRANSELAMISAIWKLIGSNNHLSSEECEIPSSIKETEPQSFFSHVGDKENTSDATNKEHTSNSVNDKNIGSEANENNQGTLPLKFPPSLLPECGFDLLRRMFCLDPEKRITIKDVLLHPFLHFDGEVTDDEIGHELWEEKVRGALQEEVSSINVQMPVLRFDETDLSEDDNIEADNNDAYYKFVNESDPPNFAKGDNNNDNDNNNSYSSSDDDYELDLPRIQLKLS